MGDKTELCEDCHDRKAEEVCEHCGEKRCFDCIESHQVCCERELKGGEMKVERVFTLSYYGSFGGGGVVGFGHTTDERKLPQGRSKEYGHLSFAESLSPLHAMICDLHGAPLGSKVKVTMEVE